MFLYKTEETTFLKELLQTKEVFLRSDRCIRNSLSQTKSNLTKTRQNKMKKTHTSFIEQTKQEGLQTTLLIIFNSSEQ